MLALALVLVLVAVRLGFRELAVRALERVIVRNREQHAGDLEIIADIREELVRVQGDPLDPRFVSTSDDGPPVHVV